MLKGKTIGKIKLQEGLCEVAEDYQTKIMLFKTNYRDLSQAKRNCDLLRELIEKIGK